MCEWRQKMHLPMVNVWNSTCKDNLRTFKIKYDKLKHSETLSLCVFECMCAHVSVLRQMSVCASICVSLHGPGIIGFWDRFCFQPSNKMHGCSVSQAMHSFKEPQGKTFRWEDWFVQSQRLCLNLAAPLPQRFIVAILACSPTLAVLQCCCSCDPYAVVHYCIIHSISSIGVLYVHNSTVNVGNEDMGEATAFWHLSLPSRLPLSLLFAATHILLCLML